MPASQTRRRRMTFGLLSSLGGYIGPCLVEAQELETGPGRTPSSCVESTISSRAVAVDVGTACGPDAVRDWGRGNPVRRRPDRNAQQC